MGTLLIILLLTTGLALRAGVIGARRAADSRARADTGLFDACARTLVLVLLCLLGLLALGVMYGNILGPRAVDLASVR
jgi:hypothetical protein